MGKFLQLVTGYVTAPSTTQTALTMSSGDSLTIKGTDENKNVRLVAAWADNQTAGYLRIRGTRLHDATQGIRLYSVASDIENLIAPGSGQKLVPGDTIIVDLSGSGTSGDVESAGLLIFYADLANVDAHLIGYDELMKRAVNLVGVENTLALGTAGGYSGSEAINAEYDLLKAGKEYALVGYTVSAECAAVGWTGPDFANARVGGPGNETEKQMTSEWFSHLARTWQMPLIPVINGTNKGGTTIDGVQDENGTDPLVISSFAELSPR